MADSHTVLNFSTIIERSKEIAEIQKSRTQLKNPGLSMPKVWTVDDFSFPCVLRLWHLNMQNSEARFHDHVL
jgi:hypothetical protein